ncbi:TetR family transcriptional regulator [Mycolicibacterium sp. 050158]|uniref:TetR family transcriptional regulator n=1 Tax=Mycolicibacterium sp. 050158 TaxID=3090602 RepID=UPI00299D3E5D|nr:TetR family transcriptional regulator [Mycolicibacterium sp. 050158]MDX1893101.1 TetR family transcriptional regulator [Mycolicibacterium sp. 050158]
MPPRLTESNIAIELAPRARRTERRQRVVAAAFELATQGYAHCQMRAVAAASGVAASTVYLYFPSKDDLLLACLQQWLAEFDLAATPPRSDLSPHERLLAVASELLGELAHVPQLAEAMVRPYLYSRGASVGAADAVRQQMTRIFLSAMDGSPSGVHQPMAELFTDVCMTNIPAIAQRRTSVDQLVQHLARAAALPMFVDGGGPARSVPHAKRVARQGSLTVLSSTIASGG